MGITLKEVGQILEMGIMGIHNKVDPGVMDTTVRLVVHGVAVNMVLMEVLGAAVIMHLEVTMDSQTVILDTPKVRLEDLVDTIRLATVVLEVVWEVASEAVLVEVEVDMVEWADLEVYLSTHFC